MNGYRARRRTWASAVLAALLAGTGAIALSTPAGAATPEEIAACPWLDTTKSAEERAQLLLDASTQHQKYRWLNEQAANSPDVTTFRGVEYPAQVDCTPLVIYANGAEGVANTPGTTAWPMPIAVAATFDLELGEDKAVAHGSETFDNRKAVVLGPGIASGRNPLSGRTPEYFGEDPLLSGEMAAANVRGLEDGNPDKPVVANLKHYVANEQELDRDASSSNIDERTFRQVYDLPYEIAVKESDPGSVMCSYNQINGIWACEHPVLTTSLRGEMGFDGYVMSDFGAVHSTAAALKSGMDQELNRPIYYTPALLDAALTAGEITQEDIDRAAFNVVKTYIEHGLFDHLVPDAPVPNVSTPEHKALALRIAEEGSVLLKNDGVLPVTDAQTVAVIGPTASNTPTDGVSAKTACATYLTFVRGTVLNCDALVDPLTAITEKVEAEGGTVVYDNGADPAAAAATAASADVAIVFGYLTMGETTDAPDLNLDGNGDALVSAVAEANDRTVVVVGSGTAVVMPWIDEVEGVLHTWYSGEQGGPAIANLLWGDTNPSGRLPMTFPTSLAETPLQTPEQYPGVFEGGGTERPDEEAIRQVEYTEGLEVGYKWYDENEVDPLFPFGHGLSYTSFEYSDLTVERTAEGATVRFTVTNEGDVAGDEVPQVYLTLPEAAAEPGKRLVGFERVTLGAGESTVVEVPIEESASNQPFSIWDVDADQWTIVDGAYGVDVGASSRDLRLEGQILVDNAGIAPTTTITLDPAAPTGDDGWYTGPVSATVTVTDDVDPAPGIEVRIDGGEWQVYSEPIVLSEDGEHVIEARSTDAGGSTSEVATASVKIDATAPTVAPESAEEGIVLDASDEHSGVALVEYALVDDGQPGEWSEYTAPIPVAVVNTTIAFRATDAAGNVSEELRYNYAEGLDAVLQLDDTSLTAGQRVTASVFDAVEGGYELVFRSEPQVVATLTVDADGAASAAFTVPADASLGSHVVQLVDGSGSVVAEVTVQVVGSGLASTGAELGWWPLLALLLLVGGGALVMRRRSA